jgi:hypothetical protein
LIYQIAAADVLFEHRLSAAAMDRVGGVIRWARSVEKPSPRAHDAHPTIIKIRKSPKQPAHERSASPARAK